MAGHRLALAFAALLILSVAPCLCAEEVAVEDEATIMAQEDEAEASLPLEKKPPGSYSGRVQLNAEATEDGVVGFFAVKDRAYLLRLARADLLPRLQRYNGKTITLEGKVRMRGKYFIVQGIQLPAPGIPRTDRDKRSGM